jgi:hypothetical protein
MQIAGTLIIRKLVNVPCRGRCHDLHLIVTLWQSSFVALLGVGVSDRALTRPERRRCISLRPLAARSCRSADEPRRQHRPAAQAHSAFEIAEGYEPLRRRLARRVSLADFDGGTAGVHPDADCPRIDVGNFAFPRLWPGVCGAMGWLLPGVILARPGRATEETDSGQPARCWTLIVCVEAGCALDQAINQGHSKGDHLSGAHPGAPHGHDRVRAGKPRLGRSKFRRTNES